MTDIPSLIERLRSKSTDCHVSEMALYDEAAEALFRLTASPLPNEIAGLIERLLDDDIVLIGASPTRKDSAAALQRFGYVTHAAKEIQEERNEMAARIAELEADRDAIRAKTIEECAKVADHEGEAEDGGEYWIAARIAKRIRALNQPEAGGGE